MIVALHMEGRGCRFDSVGDQEIFSSYFHFPPLLLCLFVQLEKNKYKNLTLVIVQDMDNHKTLGYENSVSEPDILFLSPINHIPSCCITQIQTAPLNWVQVLHN